MIVTKSALNDFSLLSCSKVYLQNKNISIYLINDTKFITDVGLILGVTALGLSLSLHSFWQALAQRYQLRHVILFQTKRNIFSIADVARF